MTYPPGAVLPHPPTGSEQAALVAEGLTRSFGAVSALNGLTMLLPQGRVCALVGPNGAGKTTLLLILAGLLAPDGGSARVGGVDPMTDPYEVHRVVGWMPDFFGTYDDLTAREYLELFGAAHRMTRQAAAARARSLLEMVVLEDKADAPVHTLSRGQKQRLGFARSMVHSPSILLLDEPASGLDPRARIQLRDLVIAQRNEGVTVVVSSHILAELEEMSDVVAFVEAGTCRGVWALSELPRATGLRRYRLRTLEDPWAELGRNGISFERIGAAAAVIEVTGDEEAADLVRRLVGAGVRVAELTPLGGGLEGAFLALEERGEQGSPR